MELSYLFALHSSTVRHIIYIIIVYNIFRRKKQFLTLNWDHLFVPSVNGEQGSYENGKISAILSILDTPVLFCLGHLFPSPKRDIFWCLLWIVLICREELFQTRLTNQRIVHRHILTLASNVISFPVCFSELNVTLVHGDSSMCWKAAYRSPLSVKVDNRSQD